MPRHSSKKSDRQSKEVIPMINPEIKRGIWVIFLFVTALILIMSYFDLAGRAGENFDHLSALLFGQSRLLVPGIFILMAILAEIQKDFPYEPAHVIGFLLFILGVNGLIHLPLPITYSYELALMGRGGGLFGFAASFFLLQFFGFYATIVILFSLIIISILLLFNTSLAKLVETQKQFFIHLGGVGKIFFNVLQLFASSSPLIKYEPEPVFEKPDAFPKEEAEKTDKTPASTNAEGKELIINEDKKTEETVYSLPSAMSKPYTANLPPFSLLSSVRGQPSAGNIKASQYIIRKTFSNFGIDVEMGEISVGPSITQYSLRPADGVKLSKITGLNNDLALALAAHPIRIEAPIPGKSLVGIEVPNRKVALVTLRELLESEEYKQKKDKGGLLVALGKDVSGKTWFTQLNSLPHLLVAGATGSGKTVCLNAIILSLLFDHTPETLRLIMIDPKRVELPIYNGIPHLLTPVITDVTKTINALRWTIGEMERRFEILSKSGRRDIDSYNRQMENKMPYLVFIVDELADLMTAAGAEIEAAIIRLAQMARAVGIHLVLATQRPSVDIITGLIKANVPARLAFSVASLMDSRTILDTAGAEKLLGRGDMLWSGPDMSMPKRLQGAFVSEEEIKKVVDFIKGDEPPTYIDEVTAKQQAVLAFNEPWQSEDSDPLLDEAKEVIIRAGKASASLLQRRLKVGYARAARLLDLLEAAGFISPSDGAKPREILNAAAASPIISKDEPKRKQSLLFAKPEEISTLLITEKDLETQPEEFGEKPEEF